MHADGNYSIQLAVNAMTEQSTEEILLITGTNKVTTTKAILEGNTYHFADITAARMVTKSASVLMPVLFFVFGGMLILNGFATIPEGARPLGLVMGISFVVFGLMLSGDNEPTYCVRVSSISGETDAISSKDHDAIKSIVDAMHTAIASRG